MKNKSQIKNIKEAKELVKRYRSITIQEIESVRCYCIGNFGRGIANALTGFDSGDCLLCVKVNNNCPDCIYTFFSNKDRCHKGKYSPSFARIQFAETPEQLIKAVNKRAGILENLIKRIGEH